MEAWKINCLNDKYFSKWLDEMAIELSTLEESVAPDGWICQWDKYVVYNLLRLYGLTDCFIRKQSEKHAFYLINNSFKRLVRGIIVIEGVLTAY